MQAISGNNYAGFSTSMVQGAQLFMNNFANQTGGGGSPISNRVALAEACDVACDATTPPKWGAWGGALGGLGMIGANQPVGSVTYNVGGFAAGLDRADHRQLPAGRHHRLHHRHPVGLGLRRARPHGHLPGRPLWRLRPGQGLRRCRDRLRLQLEPDVAQHPDPRPAPAPPRAAPAPTSSMASSRPAIASILAPTPTPSSRRSRGCRPTPAPRTPSPRPARSRSTSPSPSRPPTRCAR